MNTNIEVKNIDTLQIFSGKPSKDSYIVFVNYGDTPEVQRIKFSTLLSVFGEFSGTVPSNSSSPGNVGAYSVDSNYIYMHNGTEWRRVATETF